MKNNVYSLRKDPRLEKIRNKARADKKESAKNKAKVKAEYIFNCFYTFNRVVNTFNWVVNTLNRVVNSFYRFLNILFGLMLNTFNT